MGVCALASAYVADTACVTHMPRNEDALLFKFQDGGCM